MNLRYIKKNKILYLFVLPALVFYAMFVYMPMVGIISSFQLYNPIKGIFGSKFVGLQNFRILVNTPAFAHTIKNTIFLNLLKLVFTFPAPIIFALLLNEIRSLKFKKVSQTLSYMPYFMSWVVVAGLWYNMFSLTNGNVNDILLALHIIKAPVLFLGEPKFFYGILVLQDIWKGCGFSAIYYIAALASVDKQLYEAAEIDGANRFQKMVHITMPGIFTTVVLLFILSLSSILSANFDQVVTMTNMQVQSATDVIDTYVFRILMNGRSTDIGVGAALSLFKGVIGFILFYISNRVVKKYSEHSFL